MLFRSEDFFKGKDVFIDSFNSFTGDEYKVIEKIAKGAENIYITVNSQRDDKREMNCKPHECRARLMKIASRFADDFRWMDTSYREARNDEIDHLQKNIFSYQPEVYPNEAKNIKLVISKDPLTEVQDVFEDILDYVKNKGGKYGDCIICAENIDSYGGLIDGTAKALCIPCFTSKRYELSGRGAVRAIKLISLLFKNSFEGDRVIEFIKTGFSSIDREEGLLFEEYIRVWNISGKNRFNSPWKNNPEGRVEDFDEESTKKLERINAVREKFMAPLMEFDKAVEELGEVSFSEYLPLFINLLLSLSMPEKLNELADRARNKGDMVGKRTHEHTWEQICQAFEGIYHTVGELKCSHENFAPMFDGVISANDTGVIPVSVDCVLTGNALMLRPGNVKRVYIIGVNEGVFPKEETGGGVFSKRELLWLKNKTPDFSDGGMDELNDQLFTFYSVASVARESLYISCHAADMMGKKSNPSRFFEDVSGIFGNIIVNNGDKKSLSQIIYLDDVIQKRVSNILSCERNISKQTLEGIYNDKLYLSQSKIDTFVMCPFSYSCKYLLKLREEKSGEIRQDVFGTLIHLVLERFLRQTNAKKGGVSEISNEEAKELIGEIIDDYAKKIGCDKDEEPRLYNLLRRVKYTVLLLALDLKNEFKSSKFTPRAFEVAIGYDSKGNDVSLPPLEIPLEDGGDAVICGYVDRLDSYSEGENVYLRVVDYKTGDKKLTEKDVETGINIQMLLYMKCICNQESKELDAATGKKEGQKYIPAGVIYHISKRPEGVNGGETLVKRNGFLLDDKSILSAMEPDGKGRYIPYKAGGRSNSGLYSKDGFDVLLDSVGQTVVRVAGEIKSGLTAVEPLKDGGHDGCKYCKMLPVCRYSKNNGISDGEE